jgi:hypothetical protein
MLATRMNPAKINWLARRARVVQLVRRRRGRAFVLGWDKVVVMRSSDSILVMISGGYDKAVKE